MDEDMNPFHPTNSSHSHLLFTFNVSGEVTKNDVVTTSMFIAFRKFICSSSRDQGCLFGQIWFTTPCQGSIFRSR
ncbi:hypothetical protein L6452_45217 [Arctium lappa]|nr:hypothetical protein L6452_45217 [Arctium lappa]